MILFQKSRIKNEKSDIQSHIKIIFRIAVSIGKQTDRDKRQIQNQSRFAHIPEGLDHLSVARNIGIRFRYKLLFFDRIKRQKPVSFDTQMQHFVEGKDRYDTGSNVLIGTKTFVEGNVTVRRRSKCRRLQYGSRIDSYLKEALLP